MNPRANKRLRSADAQRPKSRKVNQDGYLVTDYQSNSRFNKPKFPSPEKSDSETTVVNTDQREDGISGVLKNPTGLFNSIGKSFLRGRGNKEDNQDEASAQVPPAASPPADSTEESADLDAFAEESGDDVFAADEDQLAAEVAPLTTDEDVFAADNADEAPAADPNETAGDFEQLNNRILSQNLAVDLLSEDFNAGENDSIDFLAECVGKLEEISIAQEKLIEERNFFSVDEQGELTPITSLENITTELMTNVNQIATQLSAGELEDVDGELEAEVGNLRMRLSRILAASTF